jgi:uncharacterized protein (DUF362 family)
MNSIYIEMDNCKNYPGSNAYYNPNMLYPEYPWDKKDISSNPNPIYHMLRHAFYSMGYDKVNYGISSWNPLGYMIKPGQTVLLKPNWVSHENKVYKYDKKLTCLITNPSLVRAILDYVAIALKGRGKIILGDAPMQGTNLDEMFDFSGYNILFDFIKSKNIDIDISDFRKYRTEKHGGIIGKPIEINSKYGSKIIDLGNESFHYENDGKNFSYKVSDYEAKHTAQYHSKGIHQYEINNAVLLADVIINIPKPKTHRLGGITGAMKNFVGITYEKASLPHRVQGDKESGRGDAYLKKNVFKKYMDILDENQTKHSKIGNYNKSKIYNILKKVFYVLGALSSGDKFRIGSWYGNDTIWRTVADLNKIVEFADKDGNMCAESQRRILNIGDMIICGEKEGPIGPSPKPLGIIMISNNALLFDYVLCKIMGFNAKCIPSVFKTLEKHNEDMDSKIILSNVPAISERKISDLKIPVSWHFEPHSCWKGHINK